VRERRRSSDAAASAWRVSSSPARLSFQPPSSSSGSAARVITRSYASRLSPFIPDRRPSRSTSSRNSRSVTSRGASTRASTDRQSNTTMMASCRIANHVRPIYPTCESSSRRVRDWLGDSGYPSTLGAAPRQQGRKKRDRRRSLDSLGASALEFAEHRVSVLAEPACAKHVRPPEGPFSIVMAAPYGDSSVKFRLSPGRQISLKMIHRGSLRSRCDSLAAPATPTPSSPRRAGPGSATQCARTWAPGRSEKDVVGPSRR
jgi:hypothetical protein